MELTDAQYGIALPRPRGSLLIPHRQALNALLYVAKEGCTWRGLPAHFGNWHTVYVRLNRWAKRGVLERVFGELQRDQMAPHLEVLSLDSTIIKRQTSPAPLDHQATGALAARPAARGGRGLIVG